ncbi:MAG: nucleotide pyrophosphohydrolase [Clostridia bacterium]|nr:nucleotide pyrophosphohydrolase [Clostridia bacterium]
MDVKDFIKKQEEFDDKFDCLKRWNKKITQDNLDVLGYLLLAASGEIGEACNIAKKVIRGDCPLSEKYDHLSEEIVDAYIYIVKLINQLGIDLETAYENKMKINEKKFGEKDGKR